MKLKTFPPWLTAALHGGLIFGGDCGNGRKTVFFFFSYLLVEFFCGELRSRFQITRKVPDSCFTGSEVCQWAKKTKCQIFLWILAQTELIQARFEVILTFKLDIKTVQKYLTSFFHIYIPSSLSNILFGLVCHMSDPHCGLHPDHWPPASPLSLPSAP